jgi:molybdopterin/thiamine biosynthesis adenylyltransferase/rhodanese-related sulfurtransferase
MKTRRYVRQIGLPEIGPEGQDRLLNASVLCVGAGGLGSPALLYLAAAGVGRIGIIDFDRIDETNLQRQVLFSTDMVGQPKAQEAAQRIRQLNPDIQVEYYDAELDVESASRLFPIYDVILDGTDNFETKFLINDAAVKFGKPWIYGAIQGFDGQVSVFNDRGGPCYRCFQPEKPRAAVMNCAEAGVIGAIAGIIGVTQALQAIQLITRHQNFDPLVGKIWMLDARTMQTKKLSLRRNAYCLACSQDPEHIVLECAPFVCDVITEISASQLKGNNSCSLIDVRENEEWLRGHIEGATLWPLSKLMAGDIPHIPKSAEIVLYCQKGLRSLQAARVLKQNGFTSVMSLAGGYSCWTL